MMNLSDVLEFESLRPELTLIESKKTDGSFVLHQILSTILKEVDSEPKQSVIVLLTFSQTLIHYKSIQAKLGNSTQWTNAVNGEKLIPIDLVAPLSQFGADFKGVLDKAFSTIQAKISPILAKTPSTRIYVIIDDLSITSLIGVEETLLLEFLSKIRALKENDSVYVVAYIQSFDSDTWFVNDLVHLADLVVRTESLTTGYSKEIDGQVV